MALIINKLDWRKQLNEWYLEEREQHAQRSEKIIRSDKTTFKQLIDLIALAVHPAIGTLRRYIIWIYQEIHHDAVFQTNN